MGSERLVWYISRVMSRNVSELGTDRVTAGMRDTFVRCRAVKMPMAYEEYFCRRVTGIRKRS